MKTSHRKIVALLVSAVALYFAVPAYVLHFEMSRFLFPHASAFTGRAAQANFSIMSRSGNELLVRRYGQARVGCVVFFPGQHGATAAYDFSSYVDAGLAVFTMAYPGQDGASGHAELSEIEGLVGHALGTVANTCPPDRTVMSGVSLGSMLAACASSSARHAGLILVSAAPSLSAAIRVRFQSHWALAPLNLLPVSKLLKHDYSLTENFRSPLATPVVIFQGTDDVQTPIELLHNPEVLRAGVQLIAVPGATHSTAFALSKKAQLTIILKMLRQGGT